MATTITTLSNDDIRDAVADWVKKTTNTEIPRSAVSVGVISESVGYGMSERQEKRANISFTINTG